MLYQPKEVQYELFESPKSELSLLWEFAARIKEEHRRTSKRLFGEIKDLNDSLIEAKAEIEKLKMLGEKNDHN